MGLARRIKYIMDKIKLFIAKIPILLAFAFGLVILHEPERAHAVTTLTIGDNTTYFDESNNYYTSLVNALDLAVSRGICSEWNYRYFLQTYPLLEYLDVNAPYILIDVMSTSNGKYVVSISNRSASNRGYGFSNEGANFGGNYFIFNDNGVVGGKSNISRVDLGSFDTPFMVYNNSATRVYDYNGLLGNFTYYRGSPDFFDSIVEAVADSDILSVNVVVNADGTIYTVGNSCVYYASTGNMSVKPIVLSSHLLVPNEPLYVRGTTSRFTLEVYNSASEPTFTFWNDIAYSVIGESLVPDVVIPLLTPSPIPTQPYSQLTPTPMLVDSGVFGFGGTDVNVSSDYQNVLSAWLDGVNKLDNIIFLRVMVDTILTSNMFSWILIPCSFMLIAWVWGLKPFSHKDGDEK